MTLINLFELSIYARKGAKDFVLIYDTSLKDKGLLNLVLVKDFTRFDAHMKGVLETVTNVKAEPLMNETVKRGRRGSIA